MKQLSQDRKPQAVALVYDILNCGPRNRFVANGKLVHNSGSDGLNLQNLPRGGELRKSIVAPPGHVLVVSDFSSIEARMIAWLAGQEDLLEQFRNGVDVYCEFASRVFGRKITKADKTARFLGKICILGLGYSLGWRKLATMMAVGPLGQAPILFSKGDLDAMGGALDVGMECGGITSKLKGVPLQVHCSAAKHLVNSYREFYDRIPGYWKTCERILDAMHRGVNHQFGVLSTEKARLLLPNGLFLQYRGLHRDEEGSWRYIGKRGERQYLYSGKLAENVTQALSRIVMTDAMLKVGERYKVALTVHDELVCVVPEAEAEDALDYMLDCMSVAPAWCKDLPVAAEGAIGKSYGEAK